MCEICSKLTIKNDAISVVLVSLLVTFYCWVWTCNCGLGYRFHKIKYTLVVLLKPTRVPFNEHKLSLNIFSHHFTLVSWAVNKQIWALKLTNIMSNFIAELKNVYSIGKDFRNYLILVFLYQRSGQVRQMQCFCGLTHFISLGW